MKFLYNFAFPFLAYCKCKAGRLVLVAAFAASFAACGGGGGEPSITQALNSDITVQDPSVSRITPTPLPASEPVPVHEQAPPQQPSTLAQTTDVQVTEDTRALAKSLGNDPVRIFNHVRNNFAYEPYYFGSLKGSQETLLQRAGNDYDLASLMIAMLRGAGIEARYAHATVRMPISQATNWIGVDSPATALAILWSAEQVPAAEQGYQARWVHDGQGPVALEFPHVWVEARLGQTDGSWTALDPSFKTHRFTRGKNIGRVAGLSSQELVSSLLQQGSVSADGSVFTLPSPDTVDALLRQRLQKMKSALASQESALTLRQIVGDRHIIQDENAGLPNSLPFEVVGTVTRFDAIPAGERHMLRLKFQGIDTLLGLPEVAAKRLTISYVADTAGNQARLDELGGVLNVPVSALNLKPQLRIDGTLVAEGHGLSLGSKIFNNMHLGFLRGGVLLDGLTHTNIAVGGQYAIVLDTSNSSPIKIRRLAERLAAAVAATKGSQFLVDEVGGKLLHALGLAFFAFQNRLVEYAAGSQNAVVFHQVNEALVSLPVTTNYSRIPFPVVSAGFEIDNKRNAFRIASRSGDSSLNAEALRFSLLQAGSSLEDLVLRLGTGLPSTSTVALLRHAADARMSFLALSPGNASQVLPKVQDSLRAQAYISPAIEQGRSVLVPQQNLQEMDWQGLGWIERPFQDSLGGFLMGDGKQGAQTSWSLLPLSGEAQAQVVRESAQVTVEFLRRNLLGALDDSVYDMPVGQLDTAAARYADGLLIYGDVQDALLAAHQCPESTSKGCETIVLAALASVPVFDSLRAAAGFVPTYERFRAEAQTAAAATR